MQTEPSPTNKCLGFVCTVLVSQSHNKQSIYLLNLNNKALKIKLHQLWSPLLTKLFGLYQILHQLRVIKSMI